MSEGLSLVSTNIHLLNQGIKLVKQMDDHLYTRTDSRTYNSGIGKHMRHIIDHYLSLVTMEGDRINYDKRERDEQLETSRDACIKTCSQLIRALKRYLQQPELMDRNIMVKSNEGSVNKHSPWSPSSVKRELQFLISHTVHHYALIAIILRTHDFAPPEEFGLAPSTIAYQEQTRQANN